MSRYNERPAYIITVIVFTIILCALASTKACAQWDVKGCATCIDTTSAWSKFLWLQSSNKVYPKTLTDSLAINFIVPLTPMGAVNINAAQGLIVTADPNSYGVTTSIVHALSYLKSNIIYTDRLYSDTDNKKNHLINVDSTSTFFSPAVGQATIGAGDSIAITIFAVAITDIILISYGPNVQGAPISPTELSWNVWSDLPNKLIIYGISGHKVNYHRMKYSAI